jgi:5-methylcytosine-specific restriction protein A
MKTQKWSQAENTALVAAYLWMLAKHNAGEKFSKAAKRRELIGTEAQPGPLAARSEASIEFKLMNVSGCMKALGRLPLQGYQPAMNYQADLMAEICRALGITADKGSA